MKYRAEIDGLRALAVMPVILFHAGFEWFSGGFVGVDIFFVISGYLITTIIISEMAEGNFSIVNFYERRARRILPALFFVMLICLPFAWLWLTPSDLKDFGQSLVATSTFSSNILFWLDSGYFDTASELKPLLHTWSLAVEEQYYILFPLFLMLTWKLGIKWIIFFLLLIFFLSLGSAQWSVHNNLTDSLFVQTTKGWDFLINAFSNPSASFFLLPTRIWELLVGVFAAIYLKYNSNLKSHSLNQFLSLLGFGMVVYSILVFNERTPFPSLYTLIPTIGTSLLILCAVPKTIIHRMLSLKLIVSIGLISYSAYLWHQPLLAFARHRLLGELSDLLVASLCVFSLVIAWLSWRFVEKPFRDRRIFSRGRIFLFSFICIFFFSSIGLSTHIYKGFPDRTNISSKLLSSFESTHVPCVEVFTKNSTELIGCRIGEEKEKVDFILFGDSHVPPLIGLFNDIAIKKGLSVVYASAPGCLPFLKTYLLRQDRKITNCDVVNKNIFQFANENNVNGIILAARWSLYTHGDYNLRGAYFVANDKNGPFNFKNTIKQAFYNGFNETVDKYNSSKIPIHIITQAPHQKYRPMSVYFLASKGIGNIEQLSVTRGEFAKLNNVPMNSFHTRADDIYIHNLTDLFCVNNICPIGTPYRSFYSDENHLSDFGAKRLTGMIEAILSNDQ